MKRRRIAITVKSETERWLTDLADTSRYSPGRRAPQAADVLKIVALYCAFPWKIEGQA